MKEFRIDLKSFIVSAKNENEARDKAIAQLKQRMVLADCQIEDIEELEDI